MSAASLFPIRQRKELEKRQRTFAVLIPGYKEDAVIEEVAADAISQGYPNDLYDVIVVADSFKQETLERLEKLPVRVVEVSFEKSTKAKALNKAMETIGDGYERSLGFGCG
ncbi:MAG: glycosyltransferase [Owenweeksia sp.]|nr:glycosyltransferase [Owenweeksia sp.]